MINYLKALSQYFLPQHFLSKCVGKIADCRCSRLKNFLITQFTRLYKIDLSRAESPDPNHYITFNDFFCRALKPEYLPKSFADNRIICPSEGKIAQIGEIRRDQMLQAKGHYFTLPDLLGDMSLAEHFYDGRYTTIYLAPPNYHRVHMPIKGTLQKTIFIPGKLFSVNQNTSNYIPNLYARNERLVSIFTTDVGPVAVILVGAMIVGSIATVWDEKLSHPNKIQTASFPTESIALNQGAELGRFKMGSTVILLFGKDKIRWRPELSAGMNVEVGMELGEY